ncbi:retroviral-like aspartic protease family protein [Winogradskyella psychrotolerans]|uniref:retropepsin-like aspartic protease family protein n=1 Tax=Winogradskyella psychrotolerans TaxID=1344585 RepID=UPI001C06B26A|nr:retropepsin-like aspartic protease [Winogradskyella psychrotolerans]MBU2923094.1 retroviral-like aspartic protease family protein [Winogradskyella psychrotolerans]
MRKLLLIIIILFSNYTFSQKVIQMNYENGIYTIPCKVNGIPMTFIFDTGASDVSISLTEAKFLFKQGLLDQSDIKEKVKYKIANGKIEEGTKIIIKEINIDGIILNNVEASIVHQLDAPLLLGQSAISKLGSIKLDGDKLIINSEKNVNLEFLGIDLTKNIEDLGFYLDDTKEVEKFIPIDFETLNISKNHFLEEFNFNIQRVIFNKQGKIVMILLQKTISNNKSNKEENIKKIYNTIVDKITNRYWIPEQKRERASVWESNYLQLGLNIEDNERVNVVYTPKDMVANKLHPEIIGESENELKASNKKDKFIDELRETSINFINKTLLEMSSGNHRWFARILENNLEFNNEIKIDNTVNQKEAVTANKSIAYNIMRIFFLNNEFKKIFLDCEFDNFVFNMQLTGNKYNNRVSSKMKISKENLENLYVPFTENEIIQILEK